MLANPYSPSLNKSVLNDHAVTCWLTLLELGLLLVLGLQDQWPQTPHTHTMLRINTGSSSRVQELMLSLWYCYRENM